MERLIKKTGVVMSGILLGLAITAGYPVESRAGDSEFRNTINLERFIDALKDQNEVEYTNTMTLDKFVNAMKDPCQKDENTFTTLVLAMCETGVERTPIY